MASVAIRGAALLTCLLFLGGCASSQPVGLPSAAEPSEAHEALAFYEGTWTLLESQHDGFRETCSWLPGGRRHMVCVGRVSRADGVFESLGVYSFDPTSGAYLYHGFGSRGGLMKETGQRIPNGFQFTSVRGTGAEAARTRFTIVEGAQGRVSTVSETSNAEGHWQVKERLEYLRTRP